MTNGLPKITLNSGPQTAAANATWCQELLFGGAAGGGKSFWLLVDFLQDVPTYGEAWKGILFRRTFPELQELIDISSELFPPTGALWAQAKHTWVWTNGARLRFAYLEHDKHKTRYHGQAYTWVGWDELTHWADDKAYRYLRARLRASTVVPTKRIRATSNPGGPGHHWVKRHFVDHAPHGYIPRVDIETGHQVMFIPARLVDNPYLAVNDPTYVDRLKGLGSPAMVAAWLEGDWEVTEGAFFDNWDTNRHVIEPFTIPDSWTRFMVGDHGSAEPFAILWFAIAGDDYVVTKRNGVKVLIPRGCLIAYREWYGWDGQHANVGIKLPAEAIADGIHQREIHEPRRDDGKAEIRYRIMDVGEGATSGPTILERMGTRGVYCHKPDGLKARVSAHGKLGGWDMVRHRLGEAGDISMLVFFNTCTETIRTLPALQHDEARPEDVAAGEDHAGDAVRMACMSRPYIRKGPAQDLPAITDPDNYGKIRIDLDKLFKEQDRKQTRIQRI